MASNTGTLTNPGDFVEVTGTNPDRIAITKVSGTFTSLEITFSASQDGTNYDVVSVITDDRKIPTSDYVWPAGGITKFFQFAAQNRFDRFRVTCKAIAGSTAAVTITSQAS